MSDSTLENDFCDALMDAPDLSFVGTQARTLVWWLDREGYLCRPDSGSDTAMSLLREFVDSEEWMFFDDYATSCGYCEAPKIYGKQKYRDRPAIPDRFDHKPDCLVARALVVLDGSLVGLDGKGRSVRVSDP